MPPPAETRLRRLLRIATGSAIATALALVLTKLISLFSVLNAPTGRMQIAAEATFSRVLGWFLPDILGGLVLGLVLGGLFGALQLSSLTWLGRASRAVLILVQLVLAFAAAVATWIYILFGTPPTWQWFVALGGGGAGGDATDSVTSIVFSFFPLLTFGSLALLLVGGTILLARSLTWRRGRWAAWGVLALLLLIPLLGAALRPPPSPLELDRNGLVQFTRTAAGFTDELDVVAAGGSISVALGSVARKEAMPAPMVAYRRIQAQAGHRPLNVLIGILETTAVKELQVMGGPIPNTPTLVQLTRRGVLWQWHYSHIPSSMPAIYSILSGNYPEPNAESITETRPRVDCRSLSEILAGRGYRTSLWHSGRFSFYKKDRFLAGRGYDLLHDATSMPNRGRYKEGSWGLEEAATIDAMLDWIGEPSGKPSDKPFLAVWVPVYPHHPYKVPHRRYRKFRGRGRRANYRNAIYYVDQMVDRLVQGLRRRKVERDTLLILVGDHGEGFGEHPGSKMHGSKIYDEAMRTLVIWYAPGALERRHVDTRRFGHAAITPTILDLLGIEQQPQHAGVSALSRRPRPMIPLSTSHVLPLFGFVDGKWKYIHNRKSRATELFDLSRDPHERRNLAPQHKRLVKAYTDRIEPYVAAQLAWEQKLPDLDARPRREALAWEKKRWVVDPKTCTFDPAYFEVSGVRLKATRKGRNTITCTLELPARRGHLERLELRGTERIGGAWIEASVQQVLPDGGRRGISYCLLNQGNRCVGEPVPSRAALEPGGHLELDIRYVMFFRVPKDVDLYHASLAEIRYSLAPAGAKP